MTTDDATTPVPDVRIIRALIATNYYGSIILDWDRNSVLDDEIMTLKIIDAEHYDLHHAGLPGLSVWEGTGTYEPNEDGHADPVVVYRGEHRRLTAVESELIRQGLPLWPYLPNKTVRGPKKTP